jgi:hypothetical protein
LPPRARRGERRNHFTFSRSSWRRVGTRNAGDIRRPFNFGRNRPANLPPLGGAVDYISA